jgi:hypothetical protein
MASSPVVAGEVTGLDPVYPPKIVRVAFRGDGWGVAALCD